MEVWIGAGYINVTCRLCPPLGRRQKLSFGMEWGWDLGQCHQEDEAAGKTLPQRIVTLKFGKRKENGK
jgi:hypothetical protein